MDKEKERDIEFVASRYKRGRFDVNNGWKRLGISPVVSLMRIRIAAAVAAVVVLTATAAVIYRHSMVPAPVVVESPEVEVANPKAVVKVIDFEDAPLDEVVMRIADVYGVEVINVPANAEDYRLSLRFEGNPVDLVESINDILGTEMSIK